MFKRNEKVQQKKIYEFNFYKEKIVDIKVPTLSYDFIIGVEIKLPRYKYALLEEKKKYKIELFQVSNFEKTKFSNIENMREKINVKTVTNSKILLTKLYSSVKKRNGV